MTSQKVSLVDKHLVIAVPSYDGKVPLEWTMAFFELSRLALQYKFYVSISFQLRGALITNNRNIAAAEFLEKEDATHLLYIDSDILFDPMDIVKMMVHLELEEDYGIIYGAYPLKQDEVKFHVEWGDELHTSKHGFIRSTATGCGFMMIKRDVIEVMNKNYPELYYRNRFLDKPMFALFDQMIVKPKNGGDPIYLGEDVAFCRRYTETFPDRYLWCDPEIQLAHIGYKSYEATLADNLKDK